MFKLGFGEILLVVFVVFLISPMEIPKILRTIGRLWGRLRKFAAQFREYADDMDLPDLSLRGGKKDEPDRSEGKSPRPRADAREGGPGPDPSISGGESRPPNGQPQSDQGSAAVPRSVTEQRSPDSRSERQILSTGSVGMAGPRSSENERELLLNVLDSAFDFSQTHLVLPLLFDQSERVSSHARSIVMRDPVFRFAKESVSSKVPGSLLFKKNSYIETLFGNGRLHEFSSCLEQISAESMKRRLSTLSELPGIVNLDLKRIFKGEKETLLTELMERENEFQNQTRNPPLCFPVSGTGRILPPTEPGLPPVSGAADLRGENQYRPLELSGFTAALEKAGSGAGKTRILFSEGEAVLDPNFPDFLREIEKRNMLFSFETSGLIDDTEPLFLALASHALESIVLSIDAEPRDSISEREMMTLFTIVKESIARKKRLIYSHQVREPGPTEWGFFDPYIAIAPVINFRVMLHCQPERPESIERLFDRLLGYKESLLTLIDHISAQAAGRWFHIDITQPYPLCVFTRGELVRLLSHSVNIPFCASGISPASRSDLRFERCGRCVLTH